MAGEPTLYARMELRIRDFEKSMDRAVNKSDASMRRIESRTSAASKRIESSLGGIFKSFGGGLLAGAAGAFSIDGARQLLDAATRIRNALKNTGLQGEALTKVYERLYASAQKNNAPIESLVDLYSKLSLVSGELKVSQEDLLKFTDQVGMALRAGGTDAQAASGALLQLTQALGGGVVRAEEFNSILEGTPTIAMQAAAGLKEAGGSVAKLRQLVTDGKVSSEAFFKAFIAGAPVTAEKLKTAETTISGSFVRLQNVLKDVAVKFDEGTGASGKLAEFMNGPLTKAIQDLGTVFTNLATGPVSDFVSYVNGAIDAVVQKAADVGAALGTDKLGGNPYIGPGRIQDRINGAFGGATYTTPKTGRLGKAARTPAVNPVTLDDYPVSGGAANKAAATAAVRAAQEAANKINQAVANQTSVAVDLVTNMIGLNERGNRGNINSFLKAGGVDLDAAQKAWCAAFVNSALSQVGVKGSGSNVATDFMNWGTGVNVGDLQRGDVLVQPRGKQAGETGGHVGFATGQVRFQQGILQLQQISGNAADQVKEQWINASDTIIRRATDAMQLPADGLKNLSETSQAAIKASEESAQRQMQLQQQMGQLATTVMDGLVNALADGKLEGRELLQILMSVVQQLMQMQGFGGMGGSGGGGLLGMLFGGLGGGGAIPAGIPGPWGASLHSGGKVGAGGTRRRVNPAWFANAPRMHSGGVAGLRHDEVPAVLQKGETVIPRGGMGGREGTMHVNNRVNIRVEDGKSRLDTGNRTELARSINAAVQQQLVLEGRPGGILYNQRKQR